MIKTENDKQQFYAIKYETVRLYCTMISQWISIIKQNQRKIKKQ